MPEPTLESLGSLVLERRGKQGVRVTAKQIGISPATLSRVENGHLPDLENFKKICQWLKIDPSTILGMDSETMVRPTASVHFRKDKTVSPETGNALGDLIRAAQRAAVAMDET
jgi:transcriptional regulator with XRE-family HTH domain